MRYRHDRVGGVLMLALGRWATSRYHLVLGYSVLASVPSPSSTTATDPPRRRTSGAAEGSAAAPESAARGRLVHL